MGKGTLFIISGDVGSTTEALLTSLQSDSALGNIIASPNNGLDSPATLLPHIWAILDSGESLLLKATHYELKTLVTQYHALYPEEKLNLISIYIHVPLGATRAKPYDYHVVYSYDVPYASLHAIKCIIQAASPMNPRIAPFVQLALELRGKIGFNSLGNRILRHATYAVASINAQKAFFPKVQTLIDELPKAQRTIVNRRLEVPVLEAQFMYDLETSDPTHQAAVNGILWHTLLLGTAIAIVTDMPIYFLLSLIPLAMKSPYALEEPSPSKLGVFVYHAPQCVRESAAALHHLTSSPIVLAARALNLFQPQDGSSSSTAEIKDLEHGLR